MPPRKEKIPNSTPVFLPQSKQEGLSKLVMFTKYIKGKLKPPHFNSSDELYNISGISCVKIGRKAIKSYYIFITCKFCVNQKYSF